MRGGKNLPKSIANFDRISKMNNCEILIPKDCNQISVGNTNKYCTITPSKYWSMEKGDPLAFILEFNHIHLQDIKYPCTIWVKDMATTPCIQTIHSLANLSIGMKKWSWFRCRWTSIV
ncbi:hypothetical protein PPL_02468 [Heterostelium album PN500]|uniref:Uncharacterized protein n=1 Tax=Heterostelium pallidum (strain ATCC 26659 / Pp 5 / PN500) TaxID=670386 RepID=D3B261_HETP5|nr:hypothetical protein PPL_02468 [Heterostelium album PN500]EFA84436.1 hypothetical protein PPL_02468 [Heterostelium album PN500]|eukprot:XP_020436550.1 hypothetical protein PPL_02468 [Heterostelium album PN500]